MYPYIVARALPQARPAAPGQYRYKIYQHCASCAVEWTDYSRKCWLCGRFGRKGSYQKPKGAVDDWGD